MGFDYKFVYFCLGSNLGDPVLNLGQGLELLDQAKFLMLSQKSKIYWTEPQEKLDQPWFANQVVKFYISSHIKPQELLHYVLDIERQMGRERKQRYGPRTMDIDILLYEGQTLATPTLTIPHPKLTKRAFVLVPLKEIAPDLLIENKSIDFYLSKLNYNVIENKIWQS
ncbi:MAG: 2-amino-4-hydroxy-6-hydroxymethyldihydropteridine diphosphokinase [Desulfonauticus sp.]|nr:2-amino-4-hydroxy-6-hydroxymethyldihydropteridine diphosphokinase [Desulfonauticus sp.]